MKWNKRIHDLRVDHDMSQDQLAEILKISKRTLLRYENGESEPTISILIQIALLFNVSTDYIIGIKDTEEIDCPSMKEELSSIISQLNKIKEEM